MSASILNRKQLSSTERRHQKAFVRTVDNFRYGGVRGGGGPYLERQGVRKVHPMIKSLTANGHTDCVLMAAFLTLRIIGPMLWSALFFDITVPVAVGEAGKPELCEKLRLR